jgi:hypothetical protein
VEWIEHMWEAMLVCGKVQQPVFLGAVVMVKVCLLAVSVQSKGYSQMWSSSPGSLDLCWVEMQDTEEASHMYTVSGEVVGDIREMVLIVDNVDFENIVAGYGTLSAEDHKVDAGTIAVARGTADPDKDKPYLPAEVMSEVTRKFRMQ